MVLAGCVPYVSQDETEVLVRGARVDFFTRGDGEREAVLWRRERARRVGGEGAGRVFGLVEIEPYVTRAFGG